MSSINDKHWFVLRDLKRHNAKLPAYKMLQEPCYYGVERIFTPLVTKEYKSKGKKVVKTVPFLTDLLFVYSSRAVLDPIIELVSTLQYRFVRGGQMNQPMIVANDEMERFMDVVDLAEKVEYYTPEQLSQALYGKKIRIIGGPLDGKEGRLLSRHGSKRKQLIVELQGILSAAVEVDAQFIQLLEK